MIIITQYRRLIFNRYYIESTPEALVDMSDGNDQICPTRPKCHNTQLIEFSVLSYTRCKLLQPQR